MTHRTADEVEELFNTSVNPPGRRHRQVRKAPGISEDGGEPHAGYRLGSPPTAEQVRTMSTKGNSGQRRLGRALGRGRFRVRKDISGPGAPTTGDDVHTDSAGADKKQRGDPRTYGVSKTGRRV